MDLYVVLGLPHGATETEIKRAYRRLARRFHPDINPGDRAAEARFRQIAEAYETLTDPDRRSSYDSGGASHASAHRRPSGFEGFDFSAAADQSVTFGDLFAEVLVDRAAQRPRHERGADLHHTLQLSFDEALTGTTRSVTVNRRTRVSSSVFTLRTISNEVEECPENAAKDQRIADPFQGAFPKRNGPRNLRIFR